MKAKRKTAPVRLLASTSLPESDQEASAIEKLRQERLVYDGVTGLPVHPFEDPARMSASYPTTAPSESRQTGW